ncbi:MAG: sn-glycerol-3-phosphate ABC transporter ATP-binding protein UgpC [Candidatus Cloacimonetes bacterium]|nr:sn-glycerol-3-phosphate ABC transporter ATP-binding protein UgpC [Candidatus Cloacimonadota bacterium]
MAQVILKNVNKIYDGKVHVVKDNSLEIHDKEFMVLVGPSGCGKSTTLRMIAGLEEITSGEILIGDRVINNVPPKDRDIAMVFQNYALYPHMTVFNNMAYGLKLRKFSKAEIRQRVGEAAEILGLEELLERKPKALSGGQRQRVALGRAIVRHPQVFLFDEPLSNLDAKLRVQMRAEISKLHNRLNTTIIYVTHDQVEAMTMGDRIAVLHDGIIQQVDTPLNLYDHPCNMFVAGFIGSPAMNFIPGRMEQGETSRFISQGIDVAIPAYFNESLKSHVPGDVVLGIRPENIRIDTQGSTQALVEVVEPMGNEIVVYCVIDETRFLLRLEERMNLHPGDTISLDFKMDFAHFFDTETEKAYNYDISGRG